MKSLIFTLTAAIGLNAQVTLTNGTPVINTASSTITPTLPTNSTLSVIATNPRYLSGGIGNPGFFTSARWDGTIGSLTAVQSADQLGGYNAYAYNGTSIAGPNGSFRCYAAENQAVGSAGTYCTVATTPNTTTTLTDVMKWDQNGRVGIGTAIPAYTLDVNGTINASGGTQGGPRNVGVTIAAGQATFTNDGNSSNLFVGDVVGANTTGSIGFFNTIFGLSSGANILDAGSSGGNADSFFGNAAGKSVTTGSGNAGVGRNALTLLTTGSSNNAQGVNALAGVTTGSNNTGVGNSAGFNGTALSTGSSNTFIGYLSATSSATVTNSTALGATAQVTASNQVVIGGTSVTDVYLGTASALANGRGSGLQTIPILTANLPACASNFGMRAAVSDATAPAIGVALTGGGAVFAMVHCSATTSSYIVDGL